MESAVSFALGLFSVISLGAASVLTLALTAVALDGIVKGIRK